MPVSGIILLVLGTGSLVLGTWMYGVIMDRLQSETCILEGMEPRIESETQEGGVITTQYVGVCADPVWGIFLIIAGLGGIAGGVALIVRSKGSSSKIVEQNIGPIPPSPGLNKDKLFCINCGEVRLSNANFCSKCGSSQTRT